jgi:protein SCO1/2
VPEELEGIEIVEHLDAALPLELEFVDESGATVTLGDFFEGGTPVIITLNYYRCPMLCTYQLNGLVEGLNGVELAPGRDFRIVTVSIDPTEGPDLAALKKKNYLTAYKKDGAPDGWSFLTGREPQIRALADAVGFGYRWDEPTQQWAHSAAIFIATPDGRLSRYLYGLTYEPKDLRLGILEAGEGKIGSTLERFILWCYHYDDKTGQYTPHIMRITRLLGVITVAVMAAGLFVLWRRDPGRRARRAGDSRGWPEGTIHV